MAKPVLGSVLNPAHSLGDAISAVIYNEGSGTTVRDLATGRLGTLSGAQPPTWGSPGGGADSGIQFKGGVHLNSYLTWGAIAELVDFWRGTPGTIIIRGRRGTNRNNGLLGRNDDNATTRGWQISTFTGPVFQFASESTGNMYCTIVAPADSTDFELIVDHDGSLTGANLHAFLNNVAQTVTVVANGSGSKTTDAADPYRQGTTTNFTASGSSDDWIYQVMMYSRILTSQNRIDFHADPYSMFSPPVAPPDYAGALNEDDLDDVALNDWNPPSTGITMVADTGTFALAGIAASLERGLKVPAASGGFALTGQVAGLARGLKLPSVTGVFSETGNAANFFIARKLIAALGAFAETGNPAILAYARKLIAATGAFAETSPPAVLTVGKRFSALTGAFLLTGRATNFFYTHVLKADTGIFSETGRAANLAWGHKMPSSNGVFVLVLNPAALRGGKNMIAAVGNFVDNHRAANLIWAHRLPAATGAYNEASPVATLKWAHRLISATGVFTETGFAAALSRGLKVIAAKGTYNEAGIAARLAVQRRLQSQTGVFVLVSPDANLFGPAAVLTANPGVFTLLGKPAALRAARRLLAANGAFAETGNPATLRAARRLLAANGAFAEIGNPANLGIGRKLHANAGVFNLAGMDARLFHSYRMNSARGQFLFDGLPAELIHGYAFRYFGIPQAGSDFLVVIDRPFQEIMIEKFLTDAEQFNE